MNRSSDKTKLAATEEVRGRSARRDSQALY